MNDKHESNAAEAFLFPSAGTLVNLFPQDFLSTLRVSKIMSTALIPVYRADHSLYAHVNEQRLARLQAAGLINRLVRSRKGQIMRALLFIRPGEPRPTSATEVAGTRYSFKERLEHGRAWDLKHLGGDRDGKTYAPPEVRSAFLQVVADCTVK